MDSLNMQGSEAGTQTGTPTLQFNPPVASAEMALEFTAPLMRWDKPGCPSVYFYARGVRAFGHDLTFSDGHPGPEFVEVQVTGVVAAMGVNPDTRVFIRRDDPHAAQAEVVA